MAPIRLRLKGFCYQLVLSSLLIFSVSLKANASCEVPAEGLLSKCEAFLGDNYKIAWGCHEANQLIEITPSLVNTTVNIYNAVGKLTPATDGKDCALHVQSAGVSSDMTSRAAELISARIKVQGDRLATLSSNEKATIREQIRSCILAFRGIVTPLVTELQSNASYRELLPLYRDESAGRWYISTTPPIGGTQAR